MTARTLKIAIVGHTNTGKTSLIRTITRARNFGEIRDEASTTIDVSEIQQASEKLIFTYIDTPGMEDAMGILDFLEEKYPTNSRLKEAENLQKLLDDPDANREFEQEIKVIKQLFSADLTCYVVDCRLPFLPKFDDELTLISKTHHPILPILNFVQGEYLDRWKQHLKAHGIHHYLEFDTVIPPQKKRFYEQIAMMFPEYYAEIMAYIQLETLQENARLQEAMKVTANFYLNLMTLQIKEKHTTNPELILQKLNQQIEKIERRAIQALLKIYQFNEEDIAYFALLAQGSQYEKELFTSDNLIDFTVQFSKGAGVGAGLMVGIDALAGFTTLGAASATGAVIGGLAASFKHLGSSMMDKLQNLEIFCVNDEAIQHFLARMLYIVGALNGRSHAQLTPIYLESAHTISQEMRTLIHDTKSLRAHPEFCEKDHLIMDQKREKQLLQLSEKITQLYENNQG